MQYPVEWILVCKWLPVLIISEFEQWRKICIFDGTTGWVHKSMLAGKKTVMLIRDTIVFAKSSKKSEKVAKVKKHAVMEEIKTQKKWIKVLIKTSSGQKIVGWGKKKDFWRGEDEG
jgi:SH3-like domain-containing protein